ncbi:hypothetical protein L6164_021721 [Bauhinia variegata]|uniref:Uncharacterized protein n=1 Tax=Bauhinia variegata TaxID=167791 RepID=A0ACB9N049_BAUVA|nr:hypothetical protein L6164_021721 [Bauhinia variegata]
MEVMLQTQEPPSQPPVVERLNQALQQLNLDQVKTPAISLFKAISRIFEDFDAYARTNTTPKWSSFYGPFYTRYFGAIFYVNLEAFNVVDQMKKVSKAFVVHPKNVNAENATTVISFSLKLMMYLLLVMLLSKLLPEMEMGDNSKGEQLLQGTQNLPITTQIEKLKARIDKIAAACEGAEKVLADTHKAYCFGTRQGPAIAPTLDKGQAAKTQEQENLLHATVNVYNHLDLTVPYAGLRFPGDKRQITTALPMHLVDILTVGEGTQPNADASGMHFRNTQLPSNNVAGQNTLLESFGSQLIGRSAASPATATSTNSFDNTAASPLPYANSPRTSANIMNMPSPQQQTPQQQQQLIAQQQLRQSSAPGLVPLHGLHQMQFSQPLGHQQFQGGQLPLGHVQHCIGQRQLNQGNQINRLSQFSGPDSGALFSVAQATPNTQMLTSLRGMMKKKSFLRRTIPDMPATVPSQSVLPRMQFGFPGNNPQRSHVSQMLSEQMFNMGGGNPGGMVPI